MPQYDEELPGITSIQTEVAAYFDVYVVKEAYFDLYVEDLQWPPPDTTTMRGGI